MAHGPDPRLHELHALVGLPGREHVLPDRVARRGVVEPEVVAVVHRVEVLQVRHGLLADVVAGPEGGHGRAAGEVGDVDAAGDDQIVVARQADRAVLAGELDAFLRLGAVADEVAQAPDLLHALALGVLEDGLEGRKVPVDIRDERDPARHGLGCLPRLADYSSLGMKGHPAGLPLAVLGAGGAAGGCHMAAPPAERNHRAGACHRASLLQPRAAGKGARLPRYPEAAGARRAWSERRRARLPGDRSAAAAAGSALPATPARGGGPPRPDLPPAGFRGAPPPRPSPP